MYGKFLELSSDTCVNRAIPVIEDMMKDGDNRFVKYYAKNALQNLLSMYEERENGFTKQLDDLKAKNADSQRISTLQKKSESADDIAKKINLALGQ